MSFAVVIEGMALISYIVILSGGKQRRESGSGVLSAFLAIITLLQCAGMAIVVSNGSRPTTLYPTSRYIHVEHQSN